MRIDEDFLDLPLPIPTEFEMMEGDLPQTYANPPRLSFMHSRIKDGKTYEVGLRIRSGEHKFRSAGAVFDYDPVKLKPISWENEVPYDIYPKHNSWATALELPALHPLGAISDVAACAYEDGSLGYLFLYGMADKELDNLNQALCEGETEDAEPDYISPHGIPVFNNYTEQTKPADVIVVVRFLIQEKSPGVRYSFEDLCNETNPAMDIDVGSIAASSPLGNATGYTYEERAGW